MHAHMISEIKQDTFRCIKSFFWFIKNIKQNVFFLNIMTKFRNIAEILFNA